MVIEMCLTALLSGTIEYDKLGKLYDTREDVVYDFSRKTNYVLPDKYNLIQLCQKERRFPVGRSDRNKFESIFSLSSK